MLWALHTPLWYVSKGGCDCSSHDLPGTGYRVTPQAALRKERRRTRIEEEQQAREPFAPIINRAWDKANHPGGRCVLCRAQLIHTPLGSQCTLTM
jgi:hypothetical protein